MDRMRRRQFLKTFAWATSAALFPSLPVAADPSCHVPHPLSPPDSGFQARCPNCGMARSMWARTWKTFRMADSAQEACSFHCLADLSVKAEEDLRDIETALFLQPRGMVDAKSAWYVVGSSAAGTMTMVSKAAFAERRSAENFAHACGGDILDFSATFQLARRTLANENTAIDRKRLTTGKIAAPVDLRDECVVCRMFPAHYPRHRSQVAFTDGRIAHFCSTHCLFIWIGDAPRDTLRPGPSGMIWVTDFVSGRWISGRTAYYVVDSAFQGPMGEEAVAFDRQAQAREFAREKGGRVLHFHQVATGSAAWTLSFSSSAAGRFFMVV